MTASHPVEDAASIGRRLHRRDPVSIRASVGHPASVGHAPLETLRIRSRRHAPAGEITRAPVDTSRQTRSQRCAHLSERSPRASAAVGRIPRQGCFAPAAEIGRIPHRQGCFAPAAEIARVPQKPYTKTSVHKTTPFQSILIPVAQNTRRQPWGTRLRAHTRVGELPRPSVPVEQITRPLATRDVWRVPTGAHPICAAGAGWVPMCTGCPRRVPIGAAAAVGGPDMSNRSAIGEIPYPS